MNKINYDNKLFKSTSNSETGEVSSETVFHYHQKDELVWATYEGGGIVFGQIIAKILADDSLEMCYQHLNKYGELMTGKCSSIPQILANGKIRLHENWQWTCKDFAKGISTVEEI